MPDLTTTLVGTRAAIDELIGAAESAGPTWTKASAPGKWSPSQIVEHVAIALEQSANVAAGTPPTFPNFPAFLRAGIRG